MQKLYYLEARKVIVTNIPRLGCIPFEREKNTNAKGCISSFNEDISSYNKRLKRLLMDLTANLTASTFVYADIHAMLKDVLQNYRSYGAYRIIFILLLTLYLFVFSEYSYLRLTLI